MKKITRLTALMLALVLLLGTLSASATETEDAVFSLNSLTLDMYSALLADAKDVGLAANQPCGSGNSYCATLTLLADMTTAQERYDYLAKQSGTVVKGVLMHYYEQHTADGMLCLCAYPNFGAEYVPGGVNHDAACPWHFANLTVNEQYYILRKLDSAAQAEYKSTLSEDQLAELEKFSREIVFYTPCDPDSCPIAEKYNMDFFSMDTFYLYEYLDGLREADGDPSGDALEIMQHLRNEHVLDDVFCQCAQFTFEESAHKFGRSHHTGYEIGDLYIDCPWRFDQLTTAEQAQVIAELESENADTAYAYALLSGKQKAELEAFLAGVGKAEETVAAKNPDNAEETLVTANISVPTGVFGEGVTHVMEAGEALMTADKVEALNEAFNGHTLAAFDISFYNLNRPGEKLQPVNGTVQLTFTVDVSGVEGDSMQVYHLVENADGSITAEAVSESIAVNKSSSTQEITINAEAFSAYVIGALCSGTGDCGYYDFAAIESGFERAELLASWVGAAARDDSQLDKYGDFVSHLYEYHKDATEICLCVNYPNRVSELGYGSISHDVDAWDFHDNKVVCPWRFTEVSVEDQYLAIKDLTEEERVPYWAALDAKETAALRAEFDRNEIPEITASEWDDTVSTVELSFTQSDATYYQWYQNGGDEWKLIAEGVDQATLTLNISEMTALTSEYQCIATTPDGSTIESAVFEFLNEELRQWIFDVGIQDMERIVLMKNATDQGVEVEQALGVTRTRGLMSLYKGEILATITERGYIIDIATGIAVGHYDRDTGTFTMGTGN